MGLGGFIVGGALSGIGKGMAQQVEQTALDRREARLQAAREAEQAKSFENSKELQAEQYRLAGEKEAQSDERQFQNNVALTETKFKNEAALAGAKSQAELAKEERQFKRDMAKLQTEWGFRLKEGEAERAAAIRKELGKPVVQEVDQKTGQLVLGWADPDQPNGIRFARLNGDYRDAPKTTEKGSFLDRTGKDQGGSMLKKPEQKTMTRSQLEEAAKTTGKSVAQMQAEAKRLGFTIN